VAEILPQFQDTTTFTLLLLCFSYKKGLKMG